MWVLPFHGLSLDRLEKKPSHMSTNTQALMALCHHLDISDRMNSNLDWARCILPPLSPLSGYFVTATGNKTKMVIPGILFFESIHVCVALMGQFADTEPSLQIGANLIIGELSSSCAPEFSLQAFHWNVWCLHSPGKWVYSFLFVVPVSILISGETEVWFHFL